MQARKQITNSEVSTLLRVLEAVILDPHCDLMQRAGIIKAVSKTIMPTPAQLRKAKEEREAQCARAATS